MIRIFIGYDSREAVAFHVLSHSIITRSTEPVSITPIVSSQIPLLKKVHPLQSTDFAFSRFLVPWLCGFHGHAMFMDCDMLCLTDISLLWAMRDSHPLKVVKHDFRPERNKKFLGNRQTRYERKGWSSLMLFDCAQNRITPETVNVSDGLWLHKLGWLSDDAIGEIPHEWNVLVGYQEVDNPKLIHFTEGGPWHQGYEDVEYGELWFEERRRAGLA